MTRNDVRNLNDLAAYLCQRQTGGEGRREVDAAQMAEILRDLREWLFDFRTVVPTLDCPEERVMILAGRVADHVRIIRSGEEFDTFLLGREEGEE